MDKLKMHTPNMADENYKKLAALFPNAVTETVDENGEVVRAIDADVLRQEISATVVEGPQERYQFTWPDKKKSVVLANQPIAKTLRLDREKSVGRDGTPGSIDTENIYIEGDNLDVLKLLQETYLGKVKMIYIDPPYNTGNDFVYNDDFDITAEDYKGISGDYDEQGNRLFKNTDSNGRFHTDWLNMIYPRLKVAKDLLTDDGAIFISIDDNEVSNMKTIVKEIYGEKNYISTIIWHNNKKGRQMDKYIKNSCEYIVMSCKDCQSLEIFNNNVEVLSDSYTLKDDISFYKKGYPLHNGTSGFHINNRPNLCYSIYYDINTQGVVILDEKQKINGKYELVLSDDGKRLLDDGYVRIVPKKNEKYGTQRVWRWGKEKFLNEYKQELMLVKENDGYYFYQKERLLDDGTKSQKFTNYYDADTSKGRNELNTLFDNKPIFNFPKPTELIKHIANMITKDNDIVLDFFSGSGSTAHAVMQLNAEDGGNRKFIMVQLPEVCDEKSEAYKAGYKNICEIGKERIRRAGKKIKEDNKDKENIGNLDVGFRVFRVDSSNMKDVYYTPAKYKQEQLELFADNIKEDRTPEDLLFQVMLDLGIMLSSDIEETEVAEKRVFSVAGGYLIACFDSEVTDETVTEIAKQHPFYAVFRDSGMANDSVMTNFEQIFETYSPRTQRKVL